MLCSLYIYVIYNFCPIINKTVDLPFFILNLYNRPNDSNMANFNTESCHYSAAATAVAVDCVARSVVAPENIIFH